MAKERITRDMISDKRCNEMREHKDRKRQNEINKPWSHLQAMKKSIEIKSPKSRLKNQDEQRLLTANQRRRKQHQ